MEKISSVLLGLLDFPSFSSSRWCAIGPASRSVALALVDHALSLQKVSDYTAHGYKHLSAEGKRFLLVCALSIYCAAGADD